MTASPRLRRAHRLPAVLDLAAEHAKQAGIEVVLRTADLNVVLG